MKKNTFVEGTIFAYMAILITKILGAVYVIPFHRIIGESGGILYGYAYNVYNLFLSISTSGIPTAISIIIAEYNALKMFNEREYAYKIANKLIFVISFVAFLVMFIFAGNIGRFIIGDIDSSIPMQSIILVIRVISFCLLVIPFLSVTRGYLQGNKFVSVSSSSQLIEQLGRIIIALVGAYIAINVLCYDISIGVAIALSGTVIGGVLALLFLKRKIRKNDKIFMEGVTSVSDSKVSSKEIIKKIIVYAIPVIAIAVTQNIYEIIDLKCIIKGLSMIGYSGDESQLFGSIIVTWASKICMIINSLAMGLCASIIPFVVSSYVENNMVEFNKKFNQAVNTIIFVAVPLTAFIACFPEQVYSVFYSTSIKYGGDILPVLSVASILFSMQMVMNMTLQGMKRYKIVYINTFAGIITNAALDIPIILLLNKLNFYPYVGSIIATIIGQSVSITIILISLWKEFKFDYKPIVSVLLKTVVGIAGMIGILYVAKSIVPIFDRYILLLVELGILGLLSFALYFGISYFLGSAKEVFGEEFFEKFLNRFKRKN